MGADLYIRSISDAAEKKYEPLFNRAVVKRDKAMRAGDKEAQAKYQKTVEKYYDKMYDHPGYFRDSYNTSCLFWVLGLSWWEMIEEYGDEDNLLQPNTIQCFLSAVRARDVPPPSQDDVLRERIGGQDISVEELHEWRKYFEEKRVRLIDFFLLALKLNEPIYASV